MKTFVTKVNSNLIELDEANIIRDGLIVWDDGGMYSPQILGRIDSNKFTWFSLTDCGNRWENEPYEFPADAIRKALDTGGKVLHLESFSEFKQWLILRP